MENELGRTINALPGLVWTARPDGAIDFVNRRWCDYTGLGASESIGKGWQAAVHPNDLGELLAQWQSILLSGKAGDMEARLRRHDGEHHWFVFRVSPMTDPSGQIVKWCGINFDVEGRWRAEEARRARWWLPSPTRESHFRSIADSIPALVSLKLPNGKDELVNSRTLEYFGKSLDELNAASLHDTVHPDDHARLLAVSKGPGLQAVDPYDLEVRAADSFDIEVRLRRADGIYRWHHVRAFPLRDPEGPIVFWYLLQTDIDDLKRAEAQLAGEKRLLEMVAAGDSLSDILDALCRFVEDTAGDCACSVLLVDPDGPTFRHGAGSSLPKDYNTVFDGKSIDPTFGPCSLAATVKTPVIASDVLTDARWSASPWPGMMAAIDMRSCWSTPVLSGDRKALGVFAVYRHEPESPSQLQRDLIEQVTHIASIAIEGAQRESALKRSEAFLKEAQRLSSTGGFSWNVATNEITWSDEVYRIFGLEPGGPLTPDVTDLRVHPGDLPFVYEKVNQARIDGKDFGFDYRLVMPDGSVKYLHTVFHRTEDSDGRFEFVGAIQDVTQRRRSEDALGELRTELTRVARITSLGALTASIAHEVNQPLSGILTNASTSLRMLAADPPNIDGARETARRTIRDANRAAEVITRLRALFAKKAATTEPVDLSDAAQEIIALSLSELQRNGVIVRTEFAGDLPPVTGDRVQLQQVILNLVLNASDAMSGLIDRSRQLTIRTDLGPDGSVRLAVQDTGIGFGTEHAGRLFDAFFTTKSGGMGIGLSVSNSIVENHQGRLWAEANDGPGATFLFSLPRRTEGETTQDEATVHRYAAPGENGATSNTVSTQ